VEKRLEVIWVPFTLGITPEEKIYKLEFGYTGVRRKGMPKTN